MTIDLRVAALIRRARDIHPEHADLLTEQLARMSEPVRIGLIGPPGSGRSTLRRALDLNDGRDVVVGSVYFDSDQTGPRRALGLNLVADEPDAVIALVRYGHRSADVGDVPKVAVLSRADEITGGRVDSMSSARHLARGYAEPVVAVDALLACGVRPADHELLVSLARLPRDESDRRLLSADRVGEAAARLGLFGVRLGVTLVRQGFWSVEGLSAEFVRRSGINDLVEQVRRRFLDRTHLLQARSALALVERVARSTPVLAEVERLRAGAHEFAEVRLLDALTTGQVRMPTDLAEEVERLLGGHGVTLGDRLGGRDRRWIVTTLGEWLRRAEDPLASRQFVRAARVVVRTCEGLVARLT
jgi:hypothetical protein